MTNLHHAISPIDGRYGDRLELLSEYFSEKALMRERCRVELLYVLALTEPTTQEEWGINENNAPVLLNKTAHYPLFPALDADEKARVLDALKSFTEADYQRIKQIENTTKHDVKACEMFLRERVQLRNENLLHFALTSEDVNNLAYTFMLKSYLAEVQIPQLQKLLQRLCALAEAWKEIPFPCRTHGQKASPSTAGKELAVFIHRLTRQFVQLKNFRFSGKLNGAIGNYSAMLSAFPDFDWAKFCKQFLEKQGIEQNIATTQIEDHDTWATYFNISRQINNIVMDLDVDCWLYISNDLFFEKSVAGEVGSSTMPHKVNPINFENSEGNLMLSNSLLAMMADKLCRSRMQRDLSDSTVSRNMGVALAHAYLAISETMRGLDKLQINESKCLRDLQESPELLAEPIQTLLKTVGVKDPYTLLKNATRGQKPTHEALLRLVDGLDIDPKIKERIHQWTPEGYIGDAVRICEEVLENARQQFLRTNIAVIGSGGREHAIAWKLRQNQHLGAVTVLPGNGGIGGSHSSIDISDFAAIEQYCKQNAISLIVVGPEVPLSQGIVDYFRRTPIQILGPTQVAARLEGSKIYAKQFMQKHGVATADFQIFNNTTAAIPYLESKGGNAVIKYDGLAAGKGVFVCSSMDEAQEALQELRSQYGENVAFLVEDKLIGDEISIIGLTDGKTIRLLPPSQDHKQLFDNDLGPNTGGMGAFCPVPFYTEELAKAIDEQIVQPTLNGIRADKLDYKGFIYFGIMVTQQGVKLLEYNARLGDPETEVLMPALKSDLFAAINATLEGKLDQVQWEWNEGYFVDVVLASEGYPKAPINGRKITVGGHSHRDWLFDKEDLVFYAGVKQLSDMSLVTNGGRVMNVVGEGMTLDAAIADAYAKCAKVHFEGMHYRRDIGKRKSNL